MSNFHAHAPTNLQKWVHVKANKKERWNGNPASSVPPFDSYSYDVPYEFGYDPVLLLTAPFPKLVPEDRDGGKAGGKAGGTVAVRAVVMVEVVREAT